MSAPESPLDPKMWEARYLSGDTRWDRGLPAPAFRALLESPGAPPKGRIAVVGCGRGHDALLFARHGFAVTGFDFAPSAVRVARALAAVEGLSSASASPSSATPGARFEERDLFTLPGEHAGAFDWVLEHTCFCAIDPSRRADYVRIVHGLLAPGGRLVALFLLEPPAESTASSPGGSDGERPGGGPPFPASEAEIRALFGGRFGFLRFETPVLSFPSRRGRERFAVLERLPRPESMAP